LCLSHGGSRAARITIAALPPAIQAHGPYRQTRGAAGRLPRVVP